MSGPGAPDPIGDRELDRLLALVPPPPPAPTGLADRIVARAAATPQVPPLPPRRAPRGARRLVRRRTWAGAVIGSFLLAVAATAAVLGGHVDFGRLAALPAMLFHHRPSHAPRRLAGVPQGTRPARRVEVAPKPVPSSRSLGAATPVVAPGVVVPRAVLEAPNGRASLARVAPRIVMQAPGARMDRPRLRVDHSRGGEHAPAMRRHEYRIEHSPIREPIASTTSHPRSALSRDDGAAEANREALRASERVTPRPQAESDARRFASGERAERPADRANSVPLPGWRGQRWRGQGGRWRGQDRFAPWRDGAVPQREPATLTAGGDPGIVAPTRSAGYGKAGSRTGRQRGRPALGRRRGRLR